LTLADLSIDGLVGKLKATGLTDEAARRRASNFSQAANRLVREGLPGDTAARAYFVPGRIEVLGKHTDYAGGKSLLVAVERGFSLVAVPRTDTTIRAFSYGFDPTEFEFSPDLTPTMGEWSNYPMTVARRIARNFPGELRGADLSFVSDLPVASGMSSSSAMMVTTFFAIAGINDLWTRPELLENVGTDRAILAEYLGTVENGQTFGTLAGDKGVGTFGGSEDHTAMLCCKANMLSEYSFCPVGFHRDIPLSDDVTFVVGSSGVVAEKTGAARDQYNRASFLTQAVAQVWRDGTGRDDPHMAAAVMSGPDAVERIRKVLRETPHAEFSPEDLSDRFEQFYAESFEIIPAAGDALERGDFEAFGAIVDRSQELTTTQLKNQVEETVFLARTARENGALAASAFGAGFGGSVWTLVPTAEAEAFIERWSKIYHDTYPQHAERSAFFATRPAPPVMEL
jgi:galactokinase